ALLVGGEADARAAHLLHGLLAADAAEDEEDGRQQVRPLQQGHNLGSVDPLRAGAAPSVPAVAAAVLRTRALPARVAPAAVLLGAAVAVVASAAEGPQAQELLVDLGGRRTGAVVEQRQEIAAHQDVLLEGHGTDLGDDDV